MENSASRIGTATGGCTAATESFRNHRHEVANRLQIIKAYLQLNRPSDALRSLDETAVWLGSLRNWQAEQHPCNAFLLWMAANYSHVVLADVWPTVELSQVQCKDVEKAWAWLNGQVEELGLRKLTVKARVTGNGEEGRPSPFIRLEFEPTPKVSVWWSTNGAKLVQKSDFGCVIICMADESDA